YSEVFLPSGVFGHHGLVCYRISGRGAGTNYILSRNFWFTISTRCSGKRIVHRRLERRFFGRRVGQPGAQRLISDDDPNEHEGNRQSYCRAARAREGAHETPRAPSARSYAGEAEAI